MQNKTKKNKLGLHFFLNDKIVDKEEFSLILNDLVEIKGVGYAGLLNKETAVNIINSFVFGKQTQLPKFNLEKDKIEKIINKTIQKCKNFVDDDFTHFFIFPTVDTFIIEKMKGVSGLSLWKHSIMLYINPVKNWEESLKFTVAHEYCHTITHKNNSWKTILDSIIFEGLAENFREKVIGGERSPWTQAISEDEAKKILAEIEDDLEEQNEKLRQGLFYGNSGFKLWAGYTLGYYIVRDFLLNEKSKDWKLILKKDSKEILRISNYGGKNVRIN